MDNCPSPLNLRKFKIFVNVNEYLSQVLANI